MTKTLGYRSLTVIVALGMILALSSACAPAAPPSAAPPAQAPTQAPAQPPAAAGQAESKKLVVWGFIWTADWLDTLKAGFEAAHPGVTVEVNRFEYDP